MKGIAAGTRVSVSTEVVETVSVVGMKRRPRREKNQCLGPKDITGL